MAHQFQYHEKINPALVREAMEWAIRERKPMRRAAKIDDNQNEIVKALRQAGCTVLILSSVGKGCPDILVGRAAGRQNYLLEIKDGSKPKCEQKLTRDQVVFHQSWRGHICVVNSVDMALRAVGLGEG